jgi:hypothetical protein
MGRPSPGAATIEPHAACFESARSIHGRSWKRGLCSDRQLGPPCRSTLGAQATDELHAHHFCGLELARATKAGGLQDPERNASIAWAIRMPMLRMMKVPARAEAIHHLPRSASSKAGRVRCQNDSEPRLLISAPDKLQAAAARMQQAKYSPRHGSGPSTPGAGGRQAGTASTGVPGEELPAVHDMLSDDYRPNPSRLHDYSNRRDHRRC